MLHNKTNVCVRVELEMGISCTVEKQQNHFSLVHYNLDVKTIKSEALDFRIHRGKDFPKKKK